MLHERGLAPRRVQVQVAAYRPEVAVVFDQLAFEAPLKQVAGPLVPLGIPVRVAAQQVLHPA